MIKKFILMLSMLSVTASAYSQRKAGFGIEVPLSMVTTKIDLPGLMTGKIPKVEGGTSSDFGLGFTYQNAGHFDFRTGFHTWKVPFRPTVNTVDGNNNSYVVENGLLTYYGMYIRGEFGSKYFFIGGGFDFSFSNQYKTDRTYYENGVMTKRETNQSHSVLTDRFNNLFNITMNTGFKIPIEERFNIKPFVSIGTSFSSVYKTPPVTNLGGGIYYTSPQKVDLQYYMIFAFGVALEYKF